MVRPKNNLPPQSQPWSRSIEQDIEQLKTRMEITAQANNNAFGAINSSLDRLGALLSEQILVEGDDTIVSGFPLSDSNGSYITTQFDPNVPVWANKAIVIVDINFFLMTVVPELGFGTVHLIAGTGLGAQSVTVSSEYNSVLGGFLGRQVNFFVFEEDTIQYLDNIRTYVYVGEASNFDPGDGRSLSAIISIIYTR